MSFGKECYGDAFLDGTKDFSIQPSTIQHSDITYQFFYAGTNNPGSNVLFNGGKTAVGQTEPLSYLQFVSRLLANLVMLYEVEIRVLNNYPEQLNQIMQIVNTDLSGNSDVVTMFPKQNPLQKNFSDHGDVTYAVVRYNFVDNLKSPYVIDGQSYLQYKILADANCQLVFKYKQIDIKNIVYKSVFDEEFNKIKKANSVGISNFETKECN